MSNLTPLISVIVPIYNSEKFIEKCAISLLEQSFKNVEYLFINDCTPDNSISILESVIKRYPERRDQCKIIHMACNSGQAIVRRTGIKLATGEYIIHCDSDDWVESTMLSDLYKIAVEANSDYIVCDYYLNSGEQRKACYSIDKNNFIRDLLETRVTTSLWNKLISRQLYIDSSVWSPAGNMGEDLMYAVQTAYLSKKIAYVDKAYYHYIYNPNSIVSSIIKNGSLDVYFHLCRNVSDIVLWFELKGDYSKYSASLKKLRGDKYNTIFPLCKDEYYYRIWSQLFKGHKLDYILNSRTSAKDKLRILLNIFRIKL